MAVVTVTPLDVQVNLGRELTAAELDQADLWISYAALIIGQRLALDSISQSALDYVLTEAVTLRFRNPDAVTQHEVQIDDGRVSRRFAKSSGQVTILDEWWALLTPAGVTDGAFSFGPA